MMGNDVHVSLREAASVLVIDLRGEVTASADATITGAYRTACERGASNILLNLAGVSYLTSAGIAILIGILTEARQAEQHLLVTGLTPHYQKIFRMMGLAQHIPIFETEDAALSSISVDKHPYP